MIEAWVCEALLFSSLQLSGWKLPPALADCRNRVLDVQSGARRRERQRRRRAVH